MKLGIYNEPSGGALGGGESTVAWVANAARAQGHSVEVVHHQPWLRVDALEAFAGASLEGVTLRYVATRPQPWGESWLPWKRLAEARQYGHEVSSGYDVFFALVHGVPPFNHSRRGILHVLFPLMHRVEAPPPSSSPRERARALYTAREWKQRLATYQTQTVNSAYTAQWCKRLWNIDTSVLYPPVDAVFPTRDKQCSIVTIGRYTRSGHAKRQDVLVDAFAKLSRGGTSATLVSLGSLSDAPDDQSYFADLHRAVDGFPARLEANVSRAEIVEALAAGMIYWHAAGFGEAADDHPERMEHFGISTVEAMAAGCVPVVINRGGQPETVEHGVSGFVWDTLDELIGYTRRLLDNPSLRAEMSAAARRRAQAFSIDRFSREVRALLASPPPPLDHRLGHPSKVSS